MIDLRSFFENVRHNKGQIFSKSDLPHLPPCFKPTLLGELRLGMLGQFRCENLHAFDFGSYWEIHKDRRNPENHPLEHLVEDAPHWLAISIGVATGLGIAIWNHFVKDDEEL